MSESWDPPSEEGRLLRQRSSSSDAAGGGRGRWSAPRRTAEDASETPKAFKDAWIPLARSFQRTRPGPGDSPAAASSPKYEQIGLPSASSSRAPRLRVAAGKTRRFVSKIARRRRQAALGSVDEQPPRIKDLVPIAKTGTPMQDWVDLRHGLVASAGKAMGKPKLTGAIMLQVPPDAFLGLGTYGVVWRGRHRRTGEEYAVKNVAPSTAANRRQLASRERAVCERVLASPHPCLVHLFAVQEFKDNGLISLVMELCPGGDLLRKIDKGQASAKREEKPYEAPECAHLWIGQIFLGLEHLHHLDLLSRDVKPENVIFDSEDVAKLTDFGFGRLTVSAKECDWTFGIPSGTPGYCAPEILRQEAHDHTADLYSFGVLIWMLLTGGLTNSEKAWPPMGERRFPSDFEAFHNDWHLLTRCLVAPERNHARRLPDIVRDFVQGLVRREPKDRLSHAQVRGHGFMSTLQLPADGGLAASVQEWLERSADLGSVWRLD